MTDDLQFPLVNDSSEPGLCDSAGKTPMENNTRTHGSINKEQCEEYWENNAKGALTYTAFPIKDQPIVTVNASNIHGIDLFGDDRDSASFWNQHGSAKADYYELASHIPEIQEKLNAGESIEQLYYDPVLGACARLYFEPREVPKVIQYKDTFISQGGNRHRILAAQDLGLHIPVKVVGRDEPSVPAEPMPAASEEKTAPIQDTQITVNKRKFSPIQYALLGGTLLWLLLMYWIAAPSGLLQCLLWFVSAAIPFVPMVLLLRAFPALQNKKGGILLLVLFALLLLMIQKLYFWLSIAYLIVGIIALCKGVTNLLPDIYTVTLENADGTKTTETHVLGDNPEQDIKSIDSNYISQGYTKK